MLRFSLNSEDNRSFKPASRRADHPPHHAYIDALRGLAFLAVLAFHLRDHVTGLPPLLADVLGRGYAGVQLFFVVSAFTLCTSLANRAGDPALLRGFFLRRIFRIVPMFWCAIGLYLLLWGFAPRWSAPDGVNGQDLAFAALLLHGLDPHALNAAVPGGWSVATEVQFYLILPLLLSLATSLKRATLLWLGMLGVSVVAPPIISYLVGPPFYAPTQHELGRQFAFYALPTQLAVFGSGLLLFRLLGPDQAVLARFEHRLPAVPRHRALLIIAVVAAVGLPLRLTTWPLGLVATFPGHLGYGVLGALLVYALATYPLGLLVNPVTRFLGRISYSAYLLHFAVLDAVEPWVQPWTAERPQLHLVLLGSLALLLTAAGAATTHALIETPGIALGRRLIRQLAMRSPHGRVVTAL